MTLTYILQITAIFLTCCQVNNKLFATAGWPCLVPPRMGKAGKVANFPPPFQSKHLRCLLPVFSVKASRKRLHMIHASIFVIKFIRSRICRRPSRCEGSLQGTVHLARYVFAKYMTTFLRGWKYSWPPRASSRPIMESTAKRKNNYILFQMFLSALFFSGNVLLNHSLMLVQTTDVATLGADVKFHLSHISGKVNTTAKRTLSI